jgi:hypothetical protein
MPEVNRYNIETIKRDQDGKCWERGVSMMTRIRRSSIFRSEL